MLECNQDKIFAGCIQIDNGHQSGEWLGKHGHCTKHKLLLIDTM